MKRVIFKHPITGKQICENLDDSGRISDDAEIIWDESVNGLIPKELLGKTDFLSRVGDSLEVDKSKKLEWDAEQAAIVGLKKSIEDAYFLIKSKDLSASWTAAETQSVVKALVLIAQS